MLLSDIVIKISKKNIKGTQILLIYINMIIGKLTLHFKYYRFVSIMSYIKCIALRIWIEWYMTEIASEYKVSFADKSFFF